MVEIALPPHEVIGIYEPGTDGIVQVVFKMAPEDAQQFHTDVAALKVVSDGHTVALTDPKPEAIQKTHLRPLIDPQHAEIPPEIARQQGFTGGMYSNCGSVRMVRTGTCEICLDCQHNEGCG